MSRNPCLDLKAVNDIRKSKFPKEKKQILLESYIPDIKRKMEKDVINKMTMKKDLYGQELQDFIDISLNSYITSFIIDKSPACKAFLASQGKTFDEYYKMQQKGGESKKNIKPKKTKK